ncbi:MAG TPA: hypothetical protein VES79_00025 [Solirubrobacteraceae bacterium]|nr:hypothetical protein [Solirubrobacteraceae bacterium]
MLIGHLIEHGELARREVGEVLLVLFTDRQAGALPSAGVELFTGTEVGRMLH